MTTEPTIARGSQRASFFATIVKSRSSRLPRTGMSSALWWLATKIAGRWVQSRSRFSTSTVTPASDIGSEVASLTARLRPSLPSRRRRP